MQTTIEAEKKDRKKERWGRTGGGGGDGGENPQLIVIKARDRETQRRH